MFQLKDASMHYTIAQCFVNSRELFRALITFQLSGVRLYLVYNAIHKNTHRKPVGLQ